MNETSVQLGLLDGAIRLNSADRASLDLAVNLTRERYLDYACAIDPQAEDGDAVYWRIVFALLSVHSPIGATFKAYRTLRLWSVRYSRKPRYHQAIERILRSSNADDGAIMYAPTKAWYIADFTRAWESDSVPFTRQGDTDHEWRLRLVRNVRGLGIAKASFAVALCNPLTATVCCIDTHIYQLFIGEVPRKAIKPSVYFALEAQIRRLARRHKLGVFVVQWLLWDAKRGIAESHGVLSDSSRKAA